MAASGEKPFSKRAIRRHTKRIIKARKKFAKRVHRIVRGQQRRAEFLQRNEDRARQVHRIEDERIQNRRERIDQTISERRARLEKNYVKENEERRAKLYRAEKRTDERIRDYRRRQDIRIQKHRSLVVLRRVRIFKRLFRIFDYYQSAVINRLVSIEADAANLLGAGRGRAGCVDVGRRARCRRAGNAALSAEDVIDNMPSRRMVVAAFARGA